MFTMTIIVETLSSLQNLRFPSFVEVRSDKPLGNVRSLYPEAKG